MARRVDISGCYDYLSVAVRGIREGDGSIQDRLGNVFIRLSQLEDEAMPSDLRQEFASLKLRMNQVFGDITPSSVLTAAQMSAEECEQIAQRLIRMLEIVTLRLGVN